MARDELHCHFFFSLLSRSALLACADSRHVFIGKRNEQKKRRGGHLYITYPLSTVKGNSLSLRLTLSTYYVCVKKISLISCLERRVRPMHDLVVDDAVIRVRASASPFFFTIIGSVVESCELWSEVFDSLTSRSSHSGAVAQAPRQYDRSLPQPSLPQFERTEQSSFLEHNIMSCLCS
jgi:hypothetical protein